MSEKYKLKSAFTRKTTILFPIRIPAKFFLLPRVFQSLDLSIPPFCIYIHLLALQYNWEGSNTNGRNNSLCMNETNRVCCLKMHKIVDEALLSYWFVYFLWTKPFTKRKEKQNITDIHFQKLIVAICRCLSEFIICQCYLHVQMFDSYCPWIDLVLNWSCNLFLICMCFLFAFKNSSV